MRNNQRRSGLGQRPQPAPVVTPTADLAFAVPTEFVELPSRGEFYSEDHPLHKQETVEIKFMTAKDEDILSSQALLKKGLAIDRLLSSLLVEDIDSRTLLVGDRSAILIAARASGYGKEYDVEYSCTGCAEKSEINFNLEDSTITGECFSHEFLANEEVIFNEQTATFDVNLPATGVQVGLRLLTGAKEKEFSRGGINEDNLITSMLAAFLVKVNDNLDKNYVRDFINVMPVKDSKYLRDLYPKLVPKIRLIHYHTCTSCYLQKDVEVPLTAEFFWPE